jgi:hypothetical protein
MTEEIHTVSKDDTDTPIFQSSSDIPASRKLRKSEESDEKIKQQVGDYTVWIYYFKLIGAFHCLTMFSSPLPPS